MRRKNPYASALGWTALALITAGAVINFSMIVADEPGLADGTAPSAWELPIFVLGVALGMVWIVVKAVLYRAHDDAAEQD